MVEALRKRLLYKSTHRGMKETDKILGGFALQELGNLNENLLNDFDTLLDVSDNDLLSWILSKEIVPKAFDNEIFRRIVKFKENI